MNSQFLSNRNTRSTSLEIQYKTLATVTNNFTNDTAPINCVKINSIGTCDLFVFIIKSHVYKLRSVGNVKRTIFMANIRFTVSFS